MVIDSLFAVVPIVVNAGAALLPAFMAVVASIVALLFKPRELVRACRERPGIAIVVLLVAFVIGWQAWAWFHAVPETNRIAHRSGDRSRAASTDSVASPMMNIDWTRVALARIEAMKKSASVPAVVDNPASSTAVKEASKSIQTEPFIFRGGHKRLGSLGGEIAQPLKLSWHYHPRWIDNGVQKEDRDAMVLSSPAIWGDRVYGASCTLDPPDSFGAVFCLDAATGRQIWSVDEADNLPFKGFFSSPAISADGRYLVIGQGLHPDSDCRLLCLDTATGRLRWSVKVPMHIESSAVIDGETVYVGVGAIENPANHKPIGHPGFVVAVRLDDGKEAWRFDVNDPECSPAMKDGVVFFGSGFNGNAVIALKSSLSPGETAPTQLWQSRSPHPITGALTVADDLVFAGGGNGDFVFRDPNPAGVVLALQTSDGKPRWSAAMPDAVLGAVAASSRLICPVANGQVVALDIKTGSTIWANAVSGTSPVLAAAAVTDSQVFAVSQNGYLCRMHLETGETIERVYINAADKPGEQGLCISSPLIANGRLFVGSETGGLRCYTGENAP